MKTTYRNTIIMKALWQSSAIILMALAVSLASNHFRHDRLPLVGDWTPKAQLKELKTEGEPVVSLEEARALFLTKGAVFIDARPADVYRSGHIEGALNLPLDSLEESMPEVMAQVPPDSLIITYCDGESCTLSKEGALQLAGKGYSHVQVLVNGWSVWQDAGLPTEKSP